MNGKALFRKEETSGLVLLKAYQEPPTLSLTICLTKDKCINCLRAFTVFKFKT